MLREEYERIVYESCKRISYLSDVIDFAGRHRRAEDLKGVQMFIIKELRRVRAGLWNLKDSHDSEEIKRAIDSIELSELHTRRKDFRSAWGSVNAAYGFLSRISVNLFDIKKELRYMEKEIMMRGVVVGGVAGFLLGFIVYVLSLIIYYLG